MNLILRKAGLDDRALLIPLIKAYHEFEQTPPYDDDSIEQSLLPLLSSDSNVGMIWIIEQTAEPIGYIVLCFGYSLEFCGRDAFIDEFFIVAGQRGKGIGKTVLSQVQAEAPRSLARAFNLSSLRALTITFAPSLMKRCAIAAPILPGTEAPRTMAVLFSSKPIVILREQLARASNHSTLMMVFIKYLRGFFNSHGGC